MSNLPDVLDRLALLAEGVMSANGPGRTPEGLCALCLDDGGAADHDADCPWAIARTMLAPSDLTEVRRLARVLRYQR